MTGFLAIGGAHTDHTARTISPHIMGASNPVRFSSTVGGGAFNALRVAKLRGTQNCTMMSVRGGDGQGLAIEQALEKSGIADASGIFVDRITPSYTAVLDKTGELVTALADMALYETGFDRQVRRKEGRQAIAHAKAVLIDANIPQTAIETICYTAKASIFAMAISPAKIDRLLPVAHKIDVLFLNGRERAALENDHGLSVSQMGFNRCVISHGDAPLTLIDGDTQKQIKVPHITDLVDVIGAGDALVGGTIAALLRDPSILLYDAALEGITCAQLALQRHGPLCEAMDRQTFDEIHAALIAAQTIRD